MKLNDKIVSLFKIKALVGLSYQLELAISIETYNQFYLNLF